MQFLLMRVKTLTNTEKHLALALEALDMGLSPDIAGVDIELAMSCLSEIDGREVDEDIVALIFSHFCGFLSIILTLTPLMDKILAR